MLLKLRESDETEVHCHRCAQKVDVQEILTGYASKRDSAQEIVLEVRRAEARVRAELRSNQENLALEVQASQALAAQAALGMRSIVQTLAVEVNDCPRLYQLTTKPRPLLVRLFRGPQYEIILWCEHPMHEHACPERIYRFDGDKKWLSTVAPYLALTARIIGLLVPLASSAAAQIIDKRETVDDLKNKLDLVKNVADIAKESESLAKQAPAAVANSGLTRAETNGLRAFRALILKLDKTRHFAGLRRVLTSSGAYLWVCPEHYSFYDPGLPQL
jgi:hypothetical protein